jgi:hypothetical protein
MVPLDGGPLARSFTAQLVELHHAMQASWRPEAPEAGLVEWAAVQSDTGWDLDVPPITIAKIPVIITTGRQREQLCWSQLRTRFSARTGRIEAQVRADS